MYFNIEKSNLGNPGWFPVDLQKYRTSFRNLGPVRFQVRLTNLPQVLVRPRATLNQNFATPYTYHKKKRKKRKRKGKKAVSSQRTITNQSSNSQLKVTYSRIYAYSYGFILLKVSRLGFSMCLVHQFLDAMSILQIKL